MRVRVIVMLMVASFVLAAAPAAGKPTRPPDPLVDAVLTFADAADGLAGDLTMRMETSRNGATEYFADGTGGSSPANLELRGFAGSLDQGLHLGLAVLDPNECGEPPLYEGVFWLSFDRTGELSAVTWHFDMDASYLAARKKGCSWLVNERLTIRSLSPQELLPGEPVLSFVDGAVSGTFKLHRYDADAAEPHVELSRAAMQFGLVIDG